MAGELRLRRGTTQQHEIFTGAQAEVTVDTDTNSLVVHDGVTPGGFRVPNEEAFSAGDVAVSDFSGGKYEAIAYGNTLAISGTPVDELTGEPKFHVGRRCFVEGEARTIVSVTESGGNTLVEVSGPSLTGEQIGLSLGAPSESISVNVRDFGVKGDGTDETGKLLEAFRFASSFEQVVIDFAGVKAQVRNNNLSEAIFEFSDKRSVTFRMNGARIIDKTDYVTDLMTHVPIFAFRRCGAVTIEGDLVVEGQRTKTVQGDRRGGIVVEVEECEGFKGRIFSYGNSAPFQSVDGASLSPNKGVDVYLYSEFNHYGALLHNIENCEAKIVAKSPYRAVFVRGVITGDIRVNSTGQVGTSLLKAYNINPITQGVRLSLTERKPEPFYEGASVFAIELQSDTPVEMSDIAIDLDIANNPNNPLTSSLVSINNFDESGASKDVGTGHRLSNIVFSGVVDTGGLASSSLRLCNFGRLVYPLDRAEKISLKNLTVKGGGNILYRGLPFSSPTFIRELEAPESSIAFMDLAPEGSIVISDSTIRRDHIAGFPEETPVTLNRVAILNFNESEFPTKQRVYKDCLCEGYKIDRGYYNTQERRTKQIRGALSTFNAFKLKGHTRAKCVLEYFVSDNHGAIDTGSTKGAIEFFLHATPSGNISVLGKEETGKSFIGIEAGVDVEGVPGNGESYLQLSVTGYEGSDALGVFTLSIDASQSMTHANLVDIV